MEKTSHKPQSDTAGIPENHELLSQGTSENIKSLIQKNGILQVLPDLFEKEIHLKQMAENIEQVIWLRDNASGQILYVNPTFEVVWGRSCASLYANPKILIESVHPEDRVQVMVARDHSNHKPL